MYNQQLVQDNNRLNDQEYNARSIVLRSYPKALFVQLDAPCNQDCLFCSRPEAYAHFNLDEYRRKFEDKMMPALQRAERINLTGSGEMLSLPRAKENLAYFNQFVHAEKMFATNGSTLTPKMIDLIVESGNRYTIHVSMHGASAAMHRVMTAGNHYDLITRVHLDHLKKVMAQTDRLTVNMIFVATTRNISEMPAFVDFAADQRASAVVVYFNYVYRFDQKELSCYFAKEETNAMIEAAESRARERGIRICLPPKFNQKEYGREQICREAWSQCMVNPEGDIITCDVAGDSRESLLDKKDFMEMWNGAYYRRIRERLSAGDLACSTFCSRANPGAVNDFRAHFITRGRSAADIERFMEGT